MSSDFKTKKKIPFIDSVKFKKTKNNDLVDKYTEMGEYKTAKDINHCFDNFIAEMWERQSDKDQRTKARPFNTCKNKFCHLCSMLRAKKIFTQSYHALEKMKSDGHEFIGFHMVLTFKNPQVEEFGSYWEKMNKAFNLFVKESPELFGYCLGWLAGREVSQEDGAKWRNELHPHIHTVLLMKKSWDKGNAHYRLNHEEINALWDKCCKAYGLKSKIFYMQKTHVKKGSTLDPELAGICEVMKYPCDPQDLNDMSDEHFSVMARVLKGKRLMSSGGLLKKYLAMEDPEAQIVHLTEYELIEVVRCYFQYEDLSNRQLIQKKLSKEEIETYIIDKKNMSESYFKHKKARQLQQIANKPIKKYNKLIYKEIADFENNFIETSFLGQLEIEVKAIKNEYEGWFLPKHVKTIILELEDLTFQLTEQLLSDVGDIETKLLPIKTIEEFY